MAAVTVCSDFGVQEEEICHYFHLFPIYLLCYNAARCHDLSFFNSLKLALSFSFLTLIKRVDLQCINFCYTEKWFSYTFFFYILLHLWFIIGYWIHIPLLYSRAVLFIHSVYNGLHLLTPTSLSVPKPSPLWQPQVCFLCLWVCFHFVDRFICVIFWISQISDII